MIEHLNTDGSFVDTFMQRAIRDLGFELPSNDKLVKIWVESLIKELKRREQEELITHQLKQGNGK